MKKLKKSSITINGKTSEVKRGVLYHSGKPVFRGSRYDYHEFVFKNGNFAMTRTFWLYLKRELKRFKTPISDTGRRRKHR